MTLTIQDPKIPISGEDGIKEPQVIGALQVVHKNNSTKTNNDTKVRMKRKLYDLAFSGSSAAYPQFTTQKLIYQAVWQTMGRMKPLDGTIHGTGRKEWQESLVTAGVQTALDRGGFFELWRGKNGIAFNMLVDGDAFIWIRKGVKKGQAVDFNLISGTNIYVDAGALGFRGLGAGREATKCAIIFSYAWAEFCRIYPDMKEKATAGKIPRDYTTNEIGRKEIREIDRQEDIIEVCHYYDTDNELYTSFAGANCAVIETLEGSKYPDKRHGKAYIPVIQFVGIPSGEGFWNYGLPDLFWDMSDVSTKLLNMEVGHVWENTWPIVNLSVPQGEGDKYIQKTATAYDMRASGYNGMIVNEYDPNNPYEVKADVLTTPNMGSDWQMVQNTIDMSVNRCGIYLDSGDLGADPTRYQLMAEEDKRTAFVKQMLEGNATNFQAIYEYTMDAIADLGRDNKEPINIRTEIKETVEDQQSTLIEEATAQGVSPLDAEQMAQEAKDAGKIIPRVIPKRELDKFTMGTVATELLDYNYFVDIDARSGAYSTELVKLAKIEGLTDFVQPGTKAFSKVAGEAARIRGLDIDGDDFNPEAPEQQPLPPTQ